MKLFTIAAICIALTGCASQYPLPNSNTLATANYGTKVDERIIASKLPQFLDLRDPYSAIIRCSQPRQGWMQHMNSPTEYGYIYVCSVNAKNGFGGYSGERLVGLFSSGKWLRYLPEDRNRWDFSY